MRITVRVLFVVLALICGSGLWSPTAGATPTANLDDTTSHKLDELLAVRNGLRAGTPRGDAIDQLSARFLGTPYGPDMLVGSPTQPEQLVVDLRRVDCFTFLDYVEALSRSADRADFMNKLVETRYAGGQIDFWHRKHFFTDWANTPRIAATDITGSLTSAAITVSKHLNAKVDGSNYLPGIPVVDRDITYIPAGAVNDAVVSQLHTGDFIGAYADEPGLDVTHVGIFVRTPNGPVFRNATSLAAYQVVDTPLSQYVATTPGVIVLRPS
ncbi:DUF1460 domain-containing protein [Nocardia sp. NPDC051570]|uniref:DUF1460 domain-containing protein n=1 Tax=Nocardia sp. NPDC051570 TaxID=3364324 RepID=UPI003787A0E6